MSLLNTISEIQVINKVGFFKMTIIIISYNVCFNYIKIYSIFYYSITRNSKIV